jgi:hypothetical protein
MRARRSNDLPLSAYALIGDRKTAALVATDGSVDWLCYGRFDGPAVFCRLLDAERGGFLQVAPELEFRSHRRYVGDSNVLSTQFECADGSVRMTDCMPLGSSEPPVLLRRVEGLSGAVAMRVDFAPTFDYARERTAIDVTREGCIARAAHARMQLACPGPITLQGPVATGSFRIRAGETRWIVLTHGRPPLHAGAAEAALRSTLQVSKGSSRRGRSCVVAFEQFPSAANATVQDRPPLSPTVSLCRQCNCAGPSPSFLQSASLILSATPPRSGL